MNTTKNTQRTLFSNFKPEIYQNGEKIPTPSDLLATEGIAFKHITDSEQAKKTVTVLLKSDPPLGLDTETAKLDEFIDHPEAGLDPHLSRIRLIQMYGGGEAVYIFDMLSWISGCLHLYGTCQWWLTTPCLTSNIFFTPAPTRKRSAAPCSWKMQ